MNTKEMRAKARWMRLLAKLDRLATEFGRQSYSGNREMNFAAMHSTLTTLFAIAALYGNPPHDGWTTIMAFAPPSAETGLNARLSVSILRGTRKQTRKI